MSTEENKPEHTNNEQAAEGTEAAANTTEQPAPPAQEEGNTAQQATDDPVASLNEENAVLKDKLVRTLADMENLRSRTEREKADMAKYAIANFARDILSIADNLSRAIGSVPSEEGAELDPSLKTLLEGVEITNRELTVTLERHGVKQIDAKNQPFDPNLHDAMFEVPNPEIAAGMVVEVVHDGYTIGDRILRPAAVGVSKGGPKIVKEASEAETAAPAEQTETPQPAPATEQPSTEAAQSSNDATPPQSEGPTSENLGEQVDKNA